MFVNINIYMYIYMCVYIYIYIYIHTICIYICINTHIHIHTDIYVYVCVCVRVRACVYIRVDTLKSLAHFRTSVVRHEGAAMSHIEMSRVTHMNESCRAFRVKKSRAKARLK